MFLFSFFKNKLDRFESFSFFSSLLERSFIEWYFSSNNDSKQIDFVNHAIAMSRFDRKSWPLEETGAINWGREGKRREGKEFNEDTRQLDRRFAFSAFASLTFRPFAPYFPAHREAIRGATRVPKGFKERGSRPILLLSFPPPPLGTLTHEREPTRALLEKKTAFPRS